MVYVFVAALAILFAALLLGLVISTFERFRGCGRISDDIVLNDALAERLGGGR